MENKDLRDLFAGMALQGLLASCHNHNDGQGDSERFSKLAYDFADEMLNARKRTE